MFFTPVAPAVLRRTAYAPSLERFLDDTLLTARQKGYSIEQDDKTVTMSFDMPGVAKEQLSIGIEGSVVRIGSLEGAPRRYKAAYELPQDIDVAASDAKLENGVLTLKLTKKVPVSNVTQLAIN
ncbi:Hsp20/alpha crystallin family protein [Rhodoferax sediminis]|uniref:Hsp20 family protein n=1 Tax=Rhodoferax sediminis TaxID=2509614 RepID=A0A515DD13_9BURK|nr:Hsp20/alpha crystallin family protein [Rhodoferax sediminis]QDL38311.1 Hsp20 family protein [Rhodoferax sediminis]